MQPITPSRWETPGLPALAVLEDKRCCVLQPGPASWEMYPVVNRKRLTSRTHLKDLRWQWKICCHHCQQRFSTLSSSLLLPCSLFRCVLSIHTLQTPDPLPNMYLPPVKKVGLLCSSARDRPFTSLDYACFLEMEVLCFSPGENSTFPGTSHSSHYTGLLFCTFVNETLGAKSESQHYLQLCNSMCKVGRRNGREDISLTIFLYQEKNRAFLMPLINFH